MSVDLASAGNAAKINQRFKELETEIRALRQSQKALENTVGNLNGMIQAQTNMIQQVWVDKLGTGSTV